MCNQFILCGSDIFRHKKLEKLDEIVLWTNCWLKDCDTFEETITASQYLETSAGCQGYRERILPLVIDTVTFMNKMLKDKTKQILVEGANATMLDIDFGELIGGSQGDGSNWRPLVNWLTGLNWRPRMRNVVSTSYCYKK